MFGHVTHSSHPVPVLLVVTSLVSAISIVQASQCFTSIYGTSLHGHVFMVLSNLNIHQCYERCKTEVQCQSLNYYITSNTCHLSNRTIAQKIANAVHNRDAVYFENPNRIVIGSFQSLAAISCLEIRSASSAALSGTYWLLDALTGFVTQKYCNMTTGMVEECTGNPCQHGGTCHYKGRGTFTCSCTPGYTGMQCETNIDECSGSPCSNGGTCIDGVNSYTCNCVPGYTGQNCQTNINECLSSPCLNGGACVDGVNRYTCNCPSGWTGTRCQTSQVNSPECTTYTSISDANRNRNNARTATVCDSGLVTRWYRITGSAGSILASSCVPKNKCQTDATGWLNGNLPSTGDGIVTRQACFNWNSNCCNWNVNIRVRNCGSYYVYELKKPPNCSLRYCTQ